MDLGFYHADFGKVDRLIRNIDGKRCIKRVKG